MTFKEIVQSQKLTDIEAQKADYICKRWDRFSKLIGQMNNRDVLKMLKYLITHRPTSVTLGRRAVQRYNSINKVRWEDLTNGN